VDFPGFLGEVERQAAAMRAAAVTAGPDTPVPSCPGWTTLRLVSHIARVHNWVLGALDTDPAGNPPKAERPPEDWDALLVWWDNQVSTLVGKIRKLGPDAPAWTFDKNKTAAFWARRQAHETAIHRLDAEHAAAGSDRAAALPSLVFDADLAADGIDEALMLMVPRKLARERPDVGGTVLFHAADAGRAWLVRLEPGALPEVGPAGDTDTDASVVGTADAVYRAVWHRPSTAIVNGDRALVEALRTP
jgi:uncharacterized protein (TIGR03083 family)